MDFCRNLKKSFIPEKPLAEHIVLQKLFQWLRIEKLKTTFHFLKEKKRLVFRATRFSTEKHWSMKLK